MAAINQRRSLYGLRSLRVRIRADSLVRFVSLVSPFAPLYHTSMEETNNNQPFYNPFFPSLPTLLNRARYSLATY